MVKITATLVKDSPKLINPFSQKMCFENILLIFEICTTKQLQDTHEWVIWADDIRRVFFCYKVGRSYSEAWNKANSGVIGSDKSFDR